jgi:superfamily II DNA/RNA helicase
MTHDLNLSFRYEKEYISEEEFLESLYYTDPKIIDVINDNEIDVNSVYSYCSSCISLLHAKDLIETQEISLFLSFLEKIEFRAEQGILSAKRIVNSKHFQFVRSAIEKENLSNFTHPKINKIISLINEEMEEFNNNKIIIFTQFREMAEFLKNKLQNEFENHLTIEKFIGQSSKMNDFGFSQKLQSEILQKFRNDEINILIATSVAEEGIDIPNVDAIIFYEPIPSEIRLIQRRGRTGRYASGRCYILVTEDTVDIPFYIVARRKEGIMQSVLADYEQIDLHNEVERKSIVFTELNMNKSSDFELIKNFKNRRDREKKLLANRSIEEILTQLDDFSNSEEYKKIKECGVTFFSDIVKIEQQEMRNKIMKQKGKKNMSQKQRKMYLNRSVKTLINIVKTYSQDDLLDFGELKQLATDEEIVDRKFYIHFNQACHQGYLRKHGNAVQFIMDYD